MSPQLAHGKPKPFLFDRSFDDPSEVYMPGEKFGPKIKVDLPKSDQPAKDSSDEKPETKADEPPPAGNYTEEQLEAAREEGYVEGHTAALEDAESSRDHYVADAVAVISNTLSDLESRQTESNRETGEMAMRMAYAVIEKILPEHAKDHVYDSVEALVKDVLPLVYDEPVIKVRAHKMIAEGLQEKLTQVCEQSNFTGRFEVISDYEFQPGDCRVEWEGGGADRSEARLWAEIREIVSDNVGAVSVDALDEAADTFSYNATSTETQGLEDQDAEGVIAEDNAEDSEQSGGYDNNEIQEEGSEPSET